MCVWREKNMSNVGEEKEVWGGCWHWWGKLLGLLWFAQLQAVLNHPFWKLHSPKRNHPLLSSQ